MYTDTSYAALENLPWMYSTRTLELSFHRTVEDIDQRLPKGLVSDGGQCAVSFVSATCGSPNSPRRARNHVELSVYGEFLYKVAVLYRGKSWWFIPLSIVTHDFSLLRGHFMGFPKRIGHVTTSASDIFHPDLAELLPPGRAAGHASLPGTLDASGSLDRAAVPERRRIERSFLLEVVNPIAGTTQLCTPVCTFYKTQLLYEGIGSLSITTASPADAMAFRGSDLAGRLFLDAVTIGGVEAV